MVEIVSLVNVDYIWLLLTPYIINIQERQTATRIFAPTEEVREIFKKILNEELDKLWKS